MSDRRDEMERKLRGLASPARAKEDQDRLRERILARAEDLLAARLAGGRAGASRWPRPSEVLASWARLILPAAATVGLVTLFLFPMEDGTSLVQRISGGFPVGSEEVGDLSDVSGDLALTEAEEFLAEEMDGTSYAYFGETATPGGGEESGAEKGGAGEDGAGESGTEEDGTGRTR